MDSDAIKLYECTVGNHWQPSNMIPDCVPEPKQGDDDANYDVVADIDYHSGGFAPPSCMSAYVNYVSSFYDKLNRQLSEQCSFIKVNIHFFNTTIGLKPKIDELFIKYVLRIDSDVPQSNLYDHCGTALALIFDLNTPGTEHIIQPLLKILTSEVGGSCPTLEVSHFGFLLLRFNKLTCTCFFRLLDLQ